MRFVCCPHRSPHFVGCPKSTLFDILERCPELSFILVYFCTKVNGCIRKFSSPCRVQSFHYGITIFSIRRKPFCNNLRFVSSRVFYKWTICVTLELLCTIEDSRCPWALLENMKYQWDRCIRFKSIKQHNLYINLNSNECTDRASRIVGYATYSRHFESTHQPETVLSLKGLGKLPTFFSLTPR